MRPESPTRPVMPVALLAALALALPPPAQAAASTTATATACLQPLGRHEAGLLDPIARGIGELYGFRVLTLPARALPAAAWHAPRRRYRAERLLDFLAQVRTKQPGCDFVLGFTAVDVSTTKGEHADWGVLGLSYVGDGASVVSSFRKNRVSFLI